MTPSPPCRQGSCGVGGSDQGLPLTGSRALLIAALGGTFIVVGGGLLYFIRRQQTG